LTGCSIDSYVMSVLKCLIRHIVHMIRALPVDPIINKMKENVRQMIRFSVLYRICSMRNVIAATVFLCLVAASVASPLWFGDDLWLFDRSIHLCIFNRYDHIVYSAISMVVIIACYIFGHISANGRSLRI
jgi:hypothetical protein